MPKTRAPRAHPHALALAAAALCASAQAQRAETADLDRVIVTGTRSIVTKASESVSPIAIVSADDLAQTGQRNIIDALIRLEPSFNALARGGDFANIVRSATLRGLGPNQTLVLVNGKRRHTTAYIATGGVTAGAAAVDLDQIPVSAIERVEVLKDGASAQYGSDAIAGVLNIILKSSPTEGSIDASYGKFHSSKYNPNGLGDGRTRTLALNKGFKLDTAGFFNASAEFRDKLHTNQTGPELRTTTADVYASKISGDPAYELGSVAFNAALPVGIGQAYAFGTYGILDELGKLTRWSGEHRDELAALAAESTGIDVKSWSAAFARAEFTLGPVTPAHVAQQQQLADSFQSLGIIPRKINVAEIVWQAPKR